jgi:hypothetical protein
VEIRAIAVTKYDLICDGVEFDIRFRGESMSIEEVSLTKPYTVSGTRVERCFNRLKQYRPIATRYEKKAENYLTMLTIASFLLWL